jgi:hypothetical protein
MPGRARLVVGGLLTLANAIDIASGAAILVD